MLNVPRWRHVAVIIAAIWAAIFAAPNFLPPAAQASLPGWLKSINLGLDLRGGSHLLLEVGSDELYKERLENIVDEMGAALNKAEPRIRYSGRAVVGETARVRPLEPGDLDRALVEIRALAQPIATQQIGAQEQDIEVAATDDGAIEVRLSDASKEALTRDAVTRSIEVIRRRVDATGTAEITILRQGADRIVVQAPGEQDPESLKRRIGQTAKMTFHLLDVNATAAEAQAGRIPPGSELLPQDDPAEPFVLVRSRALLTGDNLSDASPGFDSRNGQSIVNFRFDQKGGRVFCQVTTKNVGQRFATVLDGKVITAPRINEPICGGQGQISGNFTTESASELAVLLRAGALPAPLEVIEQRTVGAELGQDAIRAGAVALAIAAVGVLVFMVLAYGFFGFIACVALILNVSMILAAMSMIQATLTLPGVAGLILTMAMAVDANVLIYERMRDEQANGRTPAIAIDSGFGRAMVTIIDANLTTIIAALILFQFGAGPVRGFAWTLSIGVLTSVFTAVLVTQILIAWWFRQNRPKKLPI
jgi:protein-export membrane protein SecD